MDFLRLTRRGLSTVVLALASAAFLIACSPMTKADNQLILGHIDFPTSATGEAQKEFITGVLALHSFWYEEARDHFLAAEKIDPTFGMAYWGEAMTYDNALLTEPGTQNEDLGPRVVARMDALDAQKKLRWTELERGFADAVRQRFHVGWSRDKRRKAYAEAMSKLAHKYPDNDEVVVFTALALMSMPGFDNNNPAYVVAIAGRLEQIYERNPDHPGVLHYLIHVYDSPTFALMGLRQARRYAKIAPASSHALHMPSHIFRQLGMWDEVASSNAAAYKASVDWQTRTHRPLYMRDFHSLDWLMEADLRLGRYDDAKKILKDLDTIEAGIKSRGEEAGKFPEVAKVLREEYQSVVAGKPLPPAN